LTGSLFVLQGWLASSSALQIALKSRFSCCHFRL